MIFSLLNRALVGIAFLWLFQVGTLAEEFEAGIDYTVFKPTKVAETEDTQSDDTEQITVIEYFSYGCLHCKRFEKHISSWLESIPDDVTFRREAVVFQRSWAPLAKAYYVACELDVLEEVHMPMFEAIHDKKQSMDDSSIERLFVKEAGLDTEEFHANYHENEAVVDHILKTHETVGAMLIRNTPSVVVDGRFIVNTRSAQSQKRIFTIVDFLIEKVRVERESINLIEEQTE